MKKIAITLTLLMTFTLCFAFIGCEVDEENNQTTICTTHDWTYISTTATCTESGSELYSCVNCKETKTEAVAAYGHNYHKNKCERCDKSLSNLSEFPEAYRNEIAEKLLLIAPYTVDSETFATSTKLYKMALDDIDTCKSNVAKAQTAYENACNQATIRRFNPVTNQWEWVPDEKVVAQREEELNSAKKSLTQAQLDLTTYEMSFKFNCEGYAWNIAILGVKASDASNYAVNYNLAYLLSLEMSVLDTTIVPSWYNEIVSSIKTLTGIDIKN